MTDPSQIKASYVGCSTDPANPEPVSVSLVESISSDRLADSLAATADITLQALSGSGIPVISTLVSVYRAQGQVRQNLELRNIIRFLQALDSTPADKRRDFTERLKAERKSAEFGENILLILGQIDNTKKAEIIGRIMAAHIEGNFSFEKSIRLVAIVNRCYIQDLMYLKNFKEGVQGSGTDIAAVLFSAGLLSERGFDGGFIDVPDSGGTIYGLNEYGRLVLKYAL